MIKKLFIINQFVLVFIIIGLIVSCILFKYDITNKYYIRTIDYTYDIHFVNNVFIISSFDGSGGWLRGGLLPKNEIIDVNTFNKQEIDFLIESNQYYTFPNTSFPDGGLYIGNFDFDKNIEIFAFEIAGMNYIRPIEIRENGSINVENLLTQAQLLLLASFWMLPNCISYFLFIIYYVTVSMIFVIRLLSNKKQKIT